MSSEFGSFLFSAKEQKAKNAFAFFPRKSDYFPPSQPVMLNFQVDHLDELLDKLSAAGVSVDPKRDQHEFGRFGWFTDPEGNRVELWDLPLNEAAGGSARIAGNRSADTNSRSIPNRSC